MGEQLEQRHTEHALESRAELAAVANKLLADAQFSLTTPVALDQGQGVRAVPVGSLGGHLKASVALASPLFQRWLELREDRGEEAAWEALANGEDGEEFCQVWDECQRELQEGAVCSVNDLTGFVTAAREGFNDRPKHLLVVWQSEGRLTSYRLAT